jgi:DNA-binding NarL/FixJ family response regulator
MDRRAISVGIIEPQRLFAPFVTQLLSDAGFRVVVTLESPTLAEIARTKPAVIFIDVDFIEVDPVRAIRQIRSVLPNATICAYTGRTEAAWSGTCSRAGANCIISKSATPEEIVAGIERAIRVGAYVEHRFEG